MKLTSRIAAAVLLLACGLTLLLFVLQRGQPVAFGAVARQLHDSHTMTADLILQATGQPPVKSRIMYLAPGRMRTEIRGKTISVVDNANKRLLTMDPERKVAWVLQVKDSAQSPISSPASPADFVEKLRQLSADAGKAVGATDINGKPARQFKASEGGQEFTIWADAKTGAPLRVQSELKFGEQQMKFTLDHILLDVPLAESLFSSEVPAGYTVEHADVAGGETTEQDLVDYLREYASRSGGALPPSLQDFKKAADALFSKGEPPKTKLDAKLMQLVLKGVRAAKFVRDLPADADWHYAGAGVKLGAKQAPVFWYRPKDSGKYQVIFGDLHAAMLSPDELRHQTSRPVETRETGK